MVTIEDIIYTAGLFDGEGSVGIAKYEQSSGFGYSPSYRVRLDLGNTNEPIIDWMLSIWNGRKSIKGRSLNCKIYYLWYLTKKLEVKSFLELIKPYSKIKTNQINLALEFQNSIVNGYGGHGVPKEEENKREQYYQQMKVLNKRGPQ